MTSRSAPAVSVVVPFLNSGRRLAAAAASVFAQTHASWELILVDGGSNDSSREFARRLAQENPERVRVLRRGGARTLGIFRSRLWGARLARAPLVALLDSDDEWHPAYLEERLARYRAKLGRKDGMLYGPAFYWRTGAAHERVGLQPVPAPGLHRPPALTRVFLESDYAKTPCASGVLVSRRILLDASGLARAAAQNAVEDQYLWSFISLRYPVVVSPRPLFWNRLHAESTCARARKSGAFDGLRRRHVRWLERRLAAFGKAA